MIPSTFRKLRKRESSRKSLRRKDSERDEIPGIVDPSFELFNHCQQFHDEYHQDQPNPECALCNGELGLNTKLFHYYGISFPTKSQAASDRSYTSSVYSDSSSQSSSPTSPNGTLSRQQSLLPTFPFEGVSTNDFPFREGTMSGEDTAQPPSTCCLPEPISSLDTTESPQELECPPSYDIALATSPRSTQLRVLPERPQMMPRLDSPFSEFDPLESLVELPGDTVGHTMLQSPSSDSIVSPMTPSYASVANLQYGSRMFKSLPAIPERDGDHHEEGQGYRDDLIKRGLLI